jgi:hypothetical protein
VPHSEEQFEDAKAAYLKKSYPGDLAEVIESGTNNADTTTSTIKSSIQRRRIFPVAVSISLTIAGAVVIGVLNRSPNPPPALSVTNSDSADTPVTARHKSYSQGFKLDRLSSIKRLSVNRNRLRLFRPLPKVQRSKRPASAKRKSASLVLNRTGRSGMARTGWWKAGPVTFVSRPTKMHRSRDPQRNHYKSQRPRKRIFRTHRFHYDSITINKYRSS